MDVLKHFKFDEFGLDVQLNVLVLNVRTNQIFAGGNSVELKFTDVRWIDNAGGLRFVVVVF